MSIIDHRTTNRNYLLPDVANNLADDVARLSAALGAIDTDVGSLFASMSGKVDAPALAGYQSRSERNEANGYAGLNSAGQIDEQALPSSIKGGLVPKGNWNAAQNTPVIPVASAANRGWLYFVVADGSSAVNSGSEMINDWAAGDALWSDGTTWHKLDSTDRVTSVAGRLGNVVLTPDDIAGLSTVLAAINSSRASTTYVDSAVTIAAPPGAIMTFAMRVAPSGWLKANGALVSRSTYSALFSAIGTTFGAGDGSTTFGLPDMRGEFVRGWADNRTGVDDSRAFGSWQADDFKSHTHTVNAAREVGTYGNWNNISTATNSTVTSSPTGGTETRPRNLALLVCIKY